jgi:hypothetical protein
VFRRPVAGPTRRELSRLFELAADFVGLRSCTAKGSFPHRRFGRLFLAALAVVLVSVGGIFFASSRAFALPQVVEFSYLVL